MIDNGAAPFNPAGDTYHAAGYGAVGAAPRLGHEWSKSSRSFLNGECVEARNTGLRVEVRDSKGDPDTILTVDPAGWRAFIAGVTRGTVGPSGGR